MASDWQTIAEARKTLEDELGLSRRVSERLVLDAAIFHKFPVLLIEEGVHVRRRRLQLAENEWLDARECAVERSELGGWRQEPYLPPPVVVGEDTEIELLEVSSADEDPDKNLRVRRVRLPVGEVYQPPEQLVRNPFVVGLALVHVPALLAFAQGEPLEACLKQAEEALPERFHEREPPEAVETPPAEDVAPPKAEPAPAEAAAADQADVDAWMRQEVKALLEREIGPGEKERSYENSVERCIAETGATKRQALAAWRKAIHAAVMEYFTKLHQRNKRPLSAPGLKKFFNKQVGATNRQVDPALKEVPGPLRARGGRPRMED